jgi:hypothetical protein
MIPPLGIALRFLQSDYPAGVRIIPRAVFGLGAVRMAGESKSMTQGRHEAKAHSLPYKGMGCPKCGYDLTGTLEPRCPECGGAFDPGRLRRLGTRRRLSWRTTSVWVLLVVYLPNTWVFWIDYPWQGGYRMIWVKMFPILPVLYPAAWLSHVTGIKDQFDDGGMIALAGCTVVVMAACGVTLARRSWRWLIPVCVVLLAFEVFNAYVSYALFRM